MPETPSPAAESLPGTILHVGCGHQPLLEWLSGLDLAETRLDIDPACEPDIVASMTALGDIGPFNTVFSCHCLEHLAPHDVAVALGEFRRVLKPGGNVIVMVPDLEGVSPTDEVLFVSPAGPICGLDLFYGLRAALAEHPYMAHRTGFVSQTLQAALEAAQFARVGVQRLAGHNLLAVAHL